MTSGPITIAIRRLRRSRPRAKSSQNVGLMSAKTRIVGVSRRNTGAASTHRGPSSRATISSAKSAQPMVMGTVRARTRAYPFKK